MIRHAHFRLEKRPFQTSPNSRVKFDGIFYTDGYGVSILLQTPSDTKKMTTDKRKRGKRERELDAELFLYFEAIRPEELQNYSDVVFADPNKHDHLYTYDASWVNSELPRLFRYTSMTRRGHLGTHINRDRQERYIRPHPQSEEINNALEDLIQTDSRSIVHTAYFSRLYSNKERSLCYIRSSF
jgi:hypothetical protein